MKHWPFALLVLCITLLGGVSLGALLHRWFACQELADAHELSAWDAVCEEPLEKKP